LAVFTTKLTLPMDWINIHTSVLDSAEFLTAEPVDRGTWLCLQRYCCGQENGGRIIGAAVWKDRIWQQLAGVTLREVRRASQLWNWVGEDLVVSFYNTETEKKIQRNREVGASGGHASAIRRAAARETQATGASETVPHGQPHGTPSDQANGNHAGVRKERKGKEKECNTPIVPKGTGADGTDQTQAKPKRTPKAGSVFPSEQSADLAERMISIGALMRRQESTAWAARELEALRAARLDDCAADDFADQLTVMAAYYHAKISAEKDYRRRDLQTLLNNWTGELDRARAYARDHSDGIQKP